MKETPESFVCFYREPIKGSAVVFPVTRLRPKRRKLPTLSGALSQWVQPLAVCAVVGTIVALFCYGFYLVSTLADGWYRDTEAAREAQVDREINSTMPWGNPTIGIKYTVPRLGASGLPSKVIFRGWATTAAELPQKGNQVGDFRRVKSSPHIFVWATPAGASSPSWVDP
jgi:hypothetical protein